MADAELQKLRYRILHDALALLQRPGYGVGEVSQMIEQSTHPGTLQILADGDRISWLLSEYGKGNSDLTVADCYEMHLRACVRWRGGDPVMRSGLMEPWPVEAMDDWLGRWSVGKVCWWCLQGADSTDWPEQDHESANQAITRAPDGQHHICFEHVTLLMEALLQRPIFFVNGVPF